MQKQRVLVSVVGFSDVERHALNTVFRLSQSRDLSYAPYVPLSAPGVAAPKGVSEVALVDGDSAEAVLSHAKEMPTGQRLIWVGKDAPEHAWRVMDRPIDWAAVLHDLANGGDKQWGLEPPYRRLGIDSVEAACAFLREGQHDCVIGLGGGSSIDTAKVVAVKAVHDLPVQALKVPHVQDVPGLPIIAIPTTAGTGSEATRVTVITDAATDEKMLCMGLAYLPTLAILDYELTLTKPARLTADTGIDSLVHAVEAYVSKRANSFADGAALSAMRLIWPNLPIACAHPGNRPARECAHDEPAHAGVQRWVVEHQAGGVVLEQRGAHAVFGRELDLFVRAETWRVAVHRHQIGAAREEHRTVGHAAHRLVFAQRGVHRVGVGQEVGLERAQVE